jgi:hypothetical protein
MAMAVFDKQDAGYTRLVDRYSRYIESPILRLKFLNSTLTQAGTEGSRLRRLAWLPYIGSLRVRVMLIVELAKVLPPDKRVPLSFRIASLLYRFRLALYAFCLVLSLAICAGLVYAVIRIGTAISFAEAKGKASVASDKNGDGGLTPQRQVAPDVDPRSALPLDKIWLAERGSGYEFYSNGARVLTEFETAGPARKYYRFSADEVRGPGKAGAKDEAKPVAPSSPVLMSKPVGIVFHISESDIVPFVGRNNSSLQFMSRALLEYARGHKLYNYVIDRFGRIYRIVADENTAGHAGKSVWGDGRNIYVNLNASFIGICFEGKSASGAALGPEAINEAQVHGARVLTAVLRSKYGIDDANCVTHGLVSVNPANHLMGYHTDWVSGFPFQSLGLSDKYQSDLMAIWKFGFGYDQAYIASAGGKRWPGLDLAEAKLKEMARLDGLTPEEEKARRRRAFQVAYSMERELDKERLKVLGESSGD